jgi:hypothetical protein
MLDAITAAWDTLTPLQRDALIAERVFGHTVRWLRDPIWDDEPKPWSVGWGIVGAGNYRLLDEHGAIVEVHGRRVGDAATLEIAWAVVVAMRQRGYAMSIEPGSGEFAWAVRVRPGGVLVDADPLPRAVCLAALRALAGIGGRRGEGGDANND